MEKSKSKVEIWRSIPEYEGNYEVSSFGNVRSLDREVLTSNGQIRKYKGRVKKISINKHGYPNVNLCKDGVCVVSVVHKLVAISFLNHVPKGNKGLVIDHINNVSTDNNLSNLQLVTNRENCSKDQKNRSSEHIGVIKIRGKWQARIVVGKRLFSLGCFSVESDARDKYIKALSFHLNGGDLTLMERKQTSIHKGIHYRKDRRKWSSSYYFNGVRINIGSFKTEKLAKDARDEYLKTITN